MPSARPRRTRTVSPLAAGLGLAAASAAVILYKSRRAEATNPPRGQFLSVDGVRLHYIDRGLGVPVVLMHGLGVDSGDFATSGLIDLAAQRYRVIAFDRPGYGYSERPRDRSWTPHEQARLLHRALQRLGVQQAIVVGHSWGTLVAVAYARLFPRDVRSLVLVSGYYYPSVRLDVPLFSLPAIPVIGDLLRYTISPWIGRLLWPALMKRVFGPGRTEDKARRVPMWMVLRPSQLRAAAQESALLLPSAVQLMKEHGDLRMPVHIVAGDSDLYVSTRWQSARLHRRIAGSTYRVIPGVGHMIHHAAPEEIISAINAAANTHLDAVQASPAMSDARAAVDMLPTGGDIYRGLQR